MDYPANDAILLNSTRTDVFQFSVDVPPKF